MKYQSWLLVFYFISYYFVFMKYQFWLDFMNLFEVQILAMILSQVTWCHGFKSQIVSLRIGGMAAFVSPLPNSALAKALFIGLPLLVNLFPHCLWSLCQGGSMSFIYASGLFTLLF